MTEMVQLISNNGLAVVISAFALIMFWKLGTRYVISNETMVDTIKTSETNRDKRCAEHASAISTYGSTMERQTMIMEQSIRNMEKLVEFHGPDLKQAALHSDRNTLQLKEAVREFCDGCRQIAMNHFPASGKDVCELADKIEKKIRDSGEIV